MKRKKKHPLITYVTMMTLFIGGIFGISLTVLALSPTLSIQIDQRPPFFSPRAVSTVVGTVVQWENRTGEAHTILADDCLRRTSCPFESRIIEPGRNFVVPSIYNPGNMRITVGSIPSCVECLTVRGHRVQVLRSADI